MNPVVIPAFLQKVTPEKLEKLDRLLDYLARYSVPHLEATVMECMVSGDLERAKKYFDKLLETRKP